MRGFPFLHQLLGGLLSDWVGWFCFGVIPQECCCNEYTCWPVGVTRMRRNRIAAQVSVVGCRKAKGAIGRPSCSGFAPAPWCAGVAISTCRLHRLLTVHFNPGRRRLHRREQLENRQVGRQKNQGHAAEQREQSEHACGDRAAGLAGPGQPDQDHESRGAPDGGVEAGGQASEQRQLVAGQAEGGEGVGELRENPCADQGDGDGRDDAGDQADEQPDDSPRVCRCCWGRGKSGRSACGNIGHGQCFKVMSRYGARAGFT